jgi:hypothetical protein
MPSKSERIISDHYHLVLDSHKHLWNIGSPKSHKKSFVACVSRARENGAFGGAR